MVGWEVHEAESTDLAASLVERVATAEKLTPGALSLLLGQRSSSMKGATMLATLQCFGIAVSFRRPRVSDDNVGRSENKPRSFAVGVGQRRFE